MMGPGGSEGEVQCLQGCQACKHCGFISHSRISSKKCPKNKKYKEPVGLTENVVGTGKFAFCFVRGSDEGNLGSHRITYNCIRIPIGDCVQLCTPM
jgi:hypothetical protein